MIIPLVLTAQIVERLRQKQKGSMGQESAFCSPSMTQNILDFIHGRKRTITLCFRTFNA